jgi:hypothetical protein
MGYENRNNLGPTSGPSVAAPLAGKDMLAELLQLYEQNRGMEPTENTTRFDPGQLAAKYRPPGQMQLRFPWARPSRAS